MKKFILALFLLLSSNKYTTYSSFKERLSEIVVSWLVRRMQGKGFYYYDNYYDKTGKWIGNK